MTTNQTKEVVTPEDFFATQSPPKDFAKVQEVISSFIAKHNDGERKIALVTSGGTTVPLEKNTVRYLDNFSGGGRGSASAEYLLEAGYSVIFLHRRHSLQPYGRHFLLHKANNFLDYLTFNPQSNAVEVVPNHSQKIAIVLQQYNKAMADGRLLKVVFQTVHEYLFLLKAAAELLAVCSKRAMVYAAAAVSDFYIPMQAMAEHKIQSSIGPLTIVFHQVPKMLGPLCSTWAPTAFVVSFKLETDDSILAHKATQSLQRYGQHICIGNLLTNHKDRVVLYYKESAEAVAIERTPQEQEWGIDIEQKLITEIVKKHQAFIGDKVH